MNETDKAVTTGDEFFLEIEKQAETGEKIVKVIVISSYVFLLFDFISSIIIGTFSLLTVIKLILWSVFYFKLYIGRSWAKWLYIISCALGIILLIITFTNLAQSGLLGLLAAGMARYTLLAVLMWISVATLAAQIVFCVLLLRSKSVQEFLYRQMAG